MAAIAVIHVRKKSCDALATGGLKKGVRRSREAASDMSGNGSLLGSLPTSSAPANGVLPTRALTTRPIHALTEHAQMTHARTTLTICVLTEHALPTRALTTRPIHALAEHAQTTHARSTLTIGALTEHALPTRALTTRPIHALTEHAETTHAQATLPIQPLTEPAPSTQARLTRPINVRIGDTTHAHTILPIHPLATLAPHIQTTLPDGILTGAWTRAYHEDPERPGFFTGITALDHEIGSIPKAALTQVCAPRSMSSGKAAVLCSLLAQATDAEEVCALIDAGGCFNPGSAAMAGVDLSRLLWVRCGKKMKADFAEKSTSRPHATTDYQSMTDRDATTNFRPTTNPQSMTDSRGSKGRHSTTGSNRIATSNFRGAGAQRMQPVEQAFKAADILMQNGGFGLIVIDLGEIEERLVRKIPLTTWFRFARVIERQPTALVVFATYPAAQSCAALTLHLKNASARWHTGAHAHTQFFSGLSCEVELGKARGRIRKPAQSTKAGFTASPVWK